MKYVLEIYLNEGNKVKIEKIGVYNSIEEVRQKRSELISKLLAEGYYRKGFKGLEAGDEHYYPPHSIIKFSILEKGELK